MTWHIMERRKTGGQTKPPVRVGIVGGKFPALTIALNRDVAEQLGLTAGDAVVVLVGADEDVGQIRVRKAREHERGIALTTDKVSRQTLRLRRSLVEWWMPSTMPARKPESVRTWRITHVDGCLELAIVLNGDTTRELRKAQVAALAARKTGAT